MHVATRETPEDASDGGAAPKRDGVDREAGAAGRADYVQRQEASIDLNARSAETGSSGDVLPATAYA